MPQRIGDDDLAAGHRGSRTPGRTGVELDTDETHPTAERLDAPADRGQEPSVAAGRVEHVERSVADTSDELGRHDRIDDRGDQVGRRVPRSEPFSISSGTVGGHCATVRG